MYMARPRGRIDAVCQNPKCRYYLKEKGKDIIKSGRYKSTGHQRYYCYHCMTYFMETKGTPFYRKRLSEREITNICKHLLVDKNGIRSIERITGHHRDTIGMLLEDMAEYADQMTVYLIKNLGLSSSECSELWHFVKEHKRKLSVAAQEGLKKMMP
jgi:transposase-like protein